MSLSRLYSNRDEEISSFHARGNSPNVGDDERSRRHHIGGKLLPEDKLPHAAPFLGNRKVHQVGDNGTIGRDHDIREVRETSSVRTLKRGANRAEMPSALGNRCWALPHSWPSPCLRKMLEFSSDATAPRQPRATGPFPRANAGFREGKASMPPLEGKCYPMPSRIDAGARS
jgi:hypothetical protein